MCVGGGGGGVAERRWFRAAAVERRKKKAVPEAVFLNFSGAQESIPMNLFRQPMYPGGPVRQPYSYSVPIAPIDCCKIPAQNCYHATTKKRSKKRYRRGFVISTFLKCEY